MDMGLKNKVVLCMASAAGLGKGIAMEMAREGAKVMISTSEAFQDQLSAAQDEIERETGNRPEAFLCDVNSAEDIQKLVDHTVETLGDIWALVNMCPGPKPGPFDSFKDEDWEGGISALPSVLCAHDSRLPAVHAPPGRRTDCEFHLFLCERLSRQPDPVQYNADGSGWNE